MATVPRSSRSSHRPGLTRRQLLRGGSLAGAGLALSAVGAACGGPTDETAPPRPAVNIYDQSTVNISHEGSAGTLCVSEAPLPAPFGTALPIPPVLAPVRTDPNADYYEITQKTASLPILPGLTTEVWGYNGLVPGPTIRSRRGRRTVVTHRNELPTPVTVHLHGGKTRPEHDGYPTDLILPAGHSTTAGMGAHGDAVHHGAKEYIYEMDQPAATLWYHDHRMDFTGPQVYRGLAGFHLVGDDVEDALDLPRDGRDIPLMIMDRSFGADGQFLYPSIDPSLTGAPGVTAEYMSGVLSDCILVNGAPWPVLEVADTKYRFRILNASNARRYRLRLDRGARFTQIGSDLGLLLSPVVHDHLDIAQAERFDVIVDFSAFKVGDEITLTNEFGEGRTGQIMRFLVTRHEPDSGPVPTALADWNPLWAADVTEERDFVFAREPDTGPGMALWTINGQPFSPDTIAARPRLGATERWTIRSANVEHPFHIHLAPFQVVGAKGVNGRGSFNRGWKDTVNLDTNGVAEILIRFDGYRGKYVFHCHNLEHEDMMMMANFEVV